jgi:hypothetical protein
MMKLRPIHARLEEEQYEWLRRYCYENRAAQAAVIREALEMFREAKEGTTPAAGRNRRVTGGNAR